MEINGQRIEAGSFAILLLAGANRYPAAFEEPDRLDVWRDENRHLSFNLGVHHCLAAQIARVEAQIELRLLFEGVPNWKGDPDPRRRNPSFILREPSLLPITL